VWDFLSSSWGGSNCLRKNTLTVVLPLLLRKDLGTLLRMLRLWAVVLSANLVGTFLFVLAIGRSSVFDAHAYQCLAEIAMSHTGRRRVWDGADARDYCWLAG
jgi:formate/nitrite transporter FocA (FNT family)